ncbi:lytic polysaccharide monooxygenase [Streptomyces sp. NPDC017248]|uniref:lytic polysaccharide monooxygenase n=1 Tax=unclassified Streptomyces TaxID=2593676 RepID=UPI0037885BC4
MSAKRRVAVAVGAPVGPLLAVSLPASSASAHGWVTLPTSPQEQCAEGIVACGQITYEPRSVERPKGLRDCGGGHAQYAELDGDGKPWRVTPVGSSATFTWHHTARHATSDRQYFIGGRKIAEFDGHSQQPGADVSQQGDFAGFTGRQKVLAVWSISDTAHALYSCVGGTGGGGGGGGTTCTAAAWEAVRVYDGSDTVSYGGHTWRAKWGVTGDRPGTTGQWGVREDLGACPA